MMPSLRYPVVILMLVAGLLSACANTRLNSAWKDPSYLARPHKVMVIGVARNPVNRRIFEDEFARQIKAHGTEVVVSYSVLSDKQEGDHALIAAKLAQIKADTVLITRMVSKRTEKFYVPGTLNYSPQYPPYYGTWQNYYGHSYQYMYTPGHVEEDEYAIIETNLYEARNDQLIWSALSETGLDGPDQQRIKSYIGVMVKSMVEHGLLDK